MEYTIQLVKKHTSESYEQFADGKYCPEEAIAVLAEIAAWDTDLPFVEGLRKLGIEDYSVPEALCLLFIIDDILWDGLIPLQYERFSKSQYYDQILEGVSGLLKRGVIRYEGATSDVPERNSKRKNRYYITPKALSLLFRGHPGLVYYGDISHQAEIIPASSIQKKELYFSADNQDDIRRISQLLDQDQFLKVMDRLRSRGRKAAASFLLYGAPGTGKTELVKQLALATGRDIIIADVSKLHASFTGDTEKNYREMFNSYRYLQALSPVTPILLFNEADGILSKRGDVLRQAIDKIANRVQSLLLQELEDFEGIFIATTNIAENMDQAFERRFLYKVHMLAPDTEARTSIWRSLIPELRADEARMLALNFPFSGGQIYNVATKFDIEISLLGRAPSLKEIMAFCACEKIEAEYNSESDATSSKRNSNQKSEHHVLS